MPCYTQRAAEVSQMTTNSAAITYEIGSAFRRIESIGKNPSISLLHR
jgi:hypothetical protein